MLEYIMTASAINTPHKQIPYNPKLYKNEHLKTLLEQYNELFQSIYLNKLRLDDCDSLQTCSDAKLAIEKREAAIQSIGKIVAEHHNILARCRVYEPKLNAIRAKMDKLELQRSGFGVNLNINLLGISSCSLIGGIIFLLVDFATLGIAGITAVALSLIGLAITAILAYRDRNQAEKQYQEFQQEYDACVATEPKLEEKVDSSLVQNASKPLIGSYSDNPGVFFTHADKPVLNPLSTPVAKAA